MGRFKLGNIQRAILEALEDMADVSVAILTSGGNSRSAWRNLHKLRQENAEYKIKRSLKNLEKKGLIKISIKSGEPYVRCLKPPEERRFSDGSVTLTVKSKWDGIWRIVIFDIPERHGKARRALSFCIAKAGAVRLQDSVFVYPFPWNEEIEELADFFRVGPYVRYIEAHSLQGDEKLRNHFNL